MACGVSNKNVCMNIYTYKWISFPWLSSLTFFQGCTATCYTNTSTEVICTSQEIHVCFLQKQTYVSSLIYLWATCCCHLEVIESSPCCGSGKKTNNLDAFFLPFQVSSGFHSSRNDRACSKFKLLLWSCYCAVQTVQINQCLCNMGKNAAVWKEKKIWIWKWKD